MYDINITLYCNFDILKSVEWPIKTPYNGIKLIYYQASDVYKYISCKTRKIKYMLPLVSKC